MTTGIKIVNLLIVAQTNQLNDILAMIFNYSNIK